MAIDTPHRQDIAAFERVDGEATTASSSLRIRTYPYPMAHVVAFFSFHPTPLILSGLALTLAAASGMTVGLSSLPFALFLGAHLALLMWSVSRSLKELALAARLVTSPYLSYALLLLMLLSFTGAAAVGFLPFTARDALIHHLAVPRWWLEQGYLAPIPWHSWSFYPMLLQTAFAGLMQHGLETLIPLYHALYGLLLASTCSRLARQCSAPLASLPAAFVCLSLPVVLKLASVPLVDLGLALYCALTLSLIMDWLEEKRALPLLLSGASLGLALSTKYNALLFVAAVLPFLALALVRSSMSFRSIARTIAAILAVALLVYAPWPVQNISRTGNPLYPLAGSVFSDSPARLEDDRVGGSVSPLMLRRLHHGESWTEIAMLPVRVFLQGEDDNPRLFDGRLSPFLLFAIVPVFMRLRSPRLLLMGGTTALYFACALLLTDTRIRYLAPIFASMVVLAGIGADWLSSKTHGSRRQWIFAVMLLAHGMWAGWYLWDLIRSTQATSYFRGTISRDSYLQQYVPEYRLAQYMNEHLSSDSKTALVLTGNRFYYFHRPVRSEGHNSANQLLSWVRRTPDPNALAARFLELGFSHLIIHERRLATLAEASLTPEENVRLNAFIKHSLSPVARQGASVLFVLKSPQEAPSP